MRQFTPYEQTQLARAGLSQLQLPDSDTTPVEYLTGHLTFIDQDFLITPAVLIPRPETEELVQHIFKEVMAAQPHPATFKLLDVGCGSGVIGLSLWLQLELRGIAAQVYLSDVSDSALDLARQNAQQLLKANQLDSTCLTRLQFFESDLLNNPQLPTDLDLIVANLPYIPSSRLAKLPASVRDHEPHLALDGGIDGGQLIRELLAAAPRHLKAGGCVWLEIDDSHSLTTLSPAQQHFTLKMIKDSWGQGRFARATLNSYQP